LKCARIKRLLIRDYSILGNLDLNRGRHDLTTQPLGAFLRGQRLNVKFDGFADICERLLSITTPTFII